MPPGRYPDKVGTLTQPLTKGEEQTAPGTDSTARGNNCGLRPLTKTS